MSHFARLRSSLLVAIFLTLITAAQAQVVGGTISGTITDSTGAVIPNATVIVRNQDTGTQRTLTTSGSGSFSAPSLPIGSYTVAATSAGFAEYKRNDVAVTVGQSVQLTLALAVTGKESVTVEDTPATVNATTEQTSGLVNSRQVKELPLNGRSFDNLLSLNPGVVNYTNQRSGSTGTSNASVGSMFSVSGRRPQDNLFLLNGIEYTGASLINTTPGGTSGQLLGIDGIHEFNVVTDTYSAAYGKRDGAQISIVTTNGTNQLHGAVFDFERNHLFDARNYFDGPRIPKFQRHDFGASLGGPIKRDKLFLFANYEGYRQNLGESIVALVPDNQARLGLVPNAGTGIYASTSLAPNSAKLLNLWPTANGPEILQPSTTNPNVLVPSGVAKWTGSAPQNIREDFGTTRFDWNIATHDTFYAAYTVDDSYASTPSANPYSYVNESLREQVLSGQEQHVFSSNFLNVARAGFSRSTFYFYGYVPTAQQALAPSVRPNVPTYAIVIAGSTASNGASSISGAGANVGSNNAITRNIYTFDDHVFYTLGKHTIQGGIWLQRLQSNDNLAQDQYGQASFASLTSFLNGAIKTFTYAPQTTALGWRTLFVDGFIEDTWHITPRFEVRAGFRTETSSGWSESQNRASVYLFQGANGAINTNPISGLNNAILNNHALLLPEPRLGFAWNVFSSGHTSVTGGAGFHHTLLDALDYRLDQAAPYNTVFSYSGAATTVATPTGGTGAVSPSTVDPGISTPALLAYNLKIEQQLASATSLSIAYNGSHSYHQILNGDLNEPAFTITTDGRVFYPTATKLNPAVANTTSWWSGGSGNYNALVADLRHDFTHGFQFRANYTWSKNLDDGSAWNTSVSSNTPAFVSVPQLPHLDYGRAATDIRNILAVNGAYELPLLHLIAGNSKLGAGRQNALLRGTLGGWSLATIVSAFSGFPFSPQLGYNPTNSGDSRNPIRPDLNLAFNGQLYATGTTAQRVTQYFNPLAFTPPPTGYVGTLHRDTLTGPKYTNWDLSLLKTTHVTERVNAQFRAEFFNLLNHTNLQLPNEVVYSAAGTAPSATAGAITATANPSRQIQLGLKLLF